MSIHDRDWLREAPIRPPSSESTFTTWLIVAIVAATAVVWAMRHFNLAMPHSHPKVALEPTSPAIREQVQEPETPGPSLDDSQSPQAIYRCAAGGRVVYGDPMSCSGSLRITQAAAPTDDAPPGLTAYQQEMLDSADERIARDAEAARIEIANMRAAQASSRQECAALAAEVQAIDARTRQPLSSYEQDVWRGRRQTATSRQHALRC